MRWVSWWAWAHKLQSLTRQKLGLEGTQSPRVAYAPSTLAPLLGLPGCLSEILMGGGGARSGLGQLAQHPWEK